MNGDWLSTAGVLGGILAVAQFGYAIWKDRHGGVLRQGQAEAAKASLDAIQAEASLPHVQESLKLGNIAEAVTIQQQMMNGFREHSAWQDEQIRNRDLRITELEERLAARDQRIAELEERLEAAEKAVNEARDIISELRLTSAGEDMHPGPKGPGA